MLFIRHFHVEATLDTAEFDKLNNFVQEENCVKCTLVTLEIIPNFLSCVYKNRILGAILA